MNMLQFLDYFCFENSTACVYQFISDDDDMKNSDIKKTLSSDCSFKCIIMYLTFLMDGQ